MSELLDKLGLAKRRKTEELWDEFLRVDLGLDAIDAQIFRDFLLDHSHAPGISQGLPPWAEDFTQPKETEPLILSSRVPMMLDWIPRSFVHRFMADTIENAGRTAVITPTIYEEKSTGDFYVEHFVRVDAGAPTRALMTRYPERREIVELAWDRWRLVLGLSEADFEVARKFILEHSRTVHGLHNDLPPVVMGFNIPGENRLDPEGAWQARQIYWAASLVAELGSRREGRVHDVFLRGDNVTPAANPMILLVRGYWHIPANQIPETHSWMRLKRGGAQP